MNKNTVIGVLVAATLLGSIWGGIANRERKDLKVELRNMALEMEKLTSQAEREREKVLGKTAGIQETLLDREEQLAGARKELVALRKNIKALEAQVSGCNAKITKLTGERKKLAAKLAARQEKAVSAGQKAAGEQPELLNAANREGPDPDTARQLEEALLAVERLQQELEAARAQVVGLEKIIDEKTDAMTETGQEMDRLKINMDVLLARISEQKDELQEVRNENRELVKELAAKNEEISDLMEEMMRQPVQE